MTLTFTQLIPVFLVFILYFAGLPIVYALFGSTFFYFLVLDPSTQCWLLLQKVMNSTQSFSMLAIPFFIMSGSVMNFGGISDKMMDFCECVTGHMRGGLAQVNVLLSMLMGGCSGSANADCAMQSKMLVPEMEKRGYSKAFSAAITAASSAATPVIPPGVNLIVYCLIAQASLGRTFAAGYVPGILMSLSMMITVAIIAKKRNYPVSPRVEWKERLRALWRAVPALLSPVILLSGILLGIFSATEASVVCCLYSLFLGIFIYKELSPKGLYNVFLETLKSSGMVMALVTFSMLLATILNFNQIPQAVAAWAVATIGSKVGIILACMVLIIISGMVIDVTPAMLILIPIMMPVIRQYGINPIAFGVASTLLFSQGLLTPPVGSILYVLADYTKMPVMRIAKNMVPYIITFMVLAFCFMMFPQICTFLPGLIQ